MENIGCQSRGIQNKSYSITAINQYRCIACNSEIDNPELKSYPSSTMNALVEFDSLKVITCENCGFSFPTETIPKKSLEYYYQEFYSGYAKKVSGVENKITYSKNWYNARALSQTLLIRQFVELNPNANVLEIGPGIGNFYRTLELLGHNTNNYAIEHDHNALPSLRRLNVHTFDTSLSEDEVLMENQSFFDVIVMSHSLEHLNAVDIPYILKLIYDSLSNEGLFFCEIPNADLIKYPDADDLVNPHLSFFTKDSIRIMLKNVGFKIDFIGTTGNSQLDKKKIGKQERRRIDDENNFRYVYRGGVGIKLNVSSQSQLEARTIKVNRKMKINRIIFKTMQKILRDRLFAKILTCYRKILMPNMYDLLASSQYTYGADREFIRVIARKK